MDTRRSTEQVLAAARAMDKARAAGLPDDLLGILLAARAAWWTPGLPWPEPHDLRRAAAHPVSETVDRVLVAAIRRHLASL